MRNTIKILAIALAAVIVFGVVSCEDDVDDDDTISGNNIVSGAEVIYYVSNLAEAKKATDFSYITKWDEYPYEAVSKPLSYYLDGTPSVTVNNNKVTIILGTPKPNFLYNYSDMGIPANPSNAKFFLLDSTSTSDGNYELSLMKEGTSWDEGGGVLWYVDRDVTIRGMSGVLKKGWNYLIMSYNEKTHAYTNEASTTQPSGYKWTVYQTGDDYHYYDDDHHYYDDDDDYDDYDDYYDDDD